MKSLHILKQKLILTFTGITIMLLSAAMLITWYILRTQYITNTKANYEATYSTIKETIAASPILKDSWLSSQEKSLSCIIHIEDNKSPLLFTGTYASQTPREKLIKLAKANVSGTYISGDHKDTFFCISEVLPPFSDHQNSNISLLVLFDNSGANHFLHRLAGIFLGLWAGLSIVLSLICYIIIRLALKPTLIFLQKQNDFIASASHELRSPLTVMSANLSELHLMQHSSDSVRLLSGIERELTRMKHLTDGLLRLAASDAGITKATPDEVALETLLIELYEIYDPLMRQSGHPFRLLLPPDELPVVHADEELIKELLSILLNNAITYSGDGIPIALSALAQKRTVTVSVIDHGVGIHDQDKPLLFDRFYQSDQSRTDKKHFGLGLSIAKEIADMHHATLLVSDTQGGGATFTLVLPLAR